MTTWRSRDNKRWGVCGGSQLISLKLAPLILSSFKRADVIEPCLTHRSAYVWPVQQAILSSQVHGPHVTISKQTFARDIHVFRYKWHSYCALLISKFTTSTTGNNFWPLCSAPELPFQASSAKRRSRLPHIYGLIKNDVISHHFYSDLRSTTTSALAPSLIGSSWFT